MRSYATQPVGVLTWVPRSFPLGVMLLLGCTESSLAPAQNDTQLEALSFRGGIYDQVNPGEGYLRIEALGADPDFIANDASRIPVEVRTTGGDVETIVLTKSMRGPDSHGDYWYYDSIMIAMRDGYSVHNLYGRVRSHNWRYGPVTSTAWFAEIQLFGYPAAWAVKIAEGWPGVKYAEIHAVWWTPGVNRHDLARRALSGSVRSELHSPDHVPIPNNGMFETAMGDTITATYVQPDGSVLSNYLIVGQPYR